MSIKSQGGVFGRNPTFNDVTVDGDLSIAGTLSIGGETITGLSYQGGWNASTNTPDIAAFSPVTGQFWIVSADGSTNVGGITNWTQGDWALYDGSAWQRVEGGNTDLTTGVQGQLAVANGGTGAADAATARTNLGLGTVASSNSYNDLDDKPTLGTAAATASTDYATAAQGTTADSALQPADIGSTVQGYDADTAKLDVAQTWTANQTFPNDSISGDVIDNGTATPDNLYVNTTTSRQVGYSTGKIQVEGSISSAALSLMNYTSFGTSPSLNFAASRGAQGVPTAVYSQDVLGRIYFAGADGTDYTTLSSAIFGKVEGTISTDRLPGQLEFYTATNASPSVLTKALQIDNTQNVTVSNGNLVIGTAGKGIDFSATSGTGTSELLDDYEEGTWTPVLKFGGATTGITYTTQSGTYTKVGNMVFARATIVLSSNGSASGGALVTGLPYVVGTTTSASIYQNGITYSGSLNVAVEGTVDRFTIQQVSDGGVNSNLDRTSFTNTASFMLAVCYQV